MLFAIFHEFDVDGGFGDAIHQKECLGYAEFSSDADAQEWCSKNSHEYVYDIPYQELWIKKLSYEPVYPSDPADLLPEDWAEEDRYYAESFDNYEEN